jgi:hypothetical protein
MITLQGKTYAKNAAEMRRALSSPAGTCAGYYRTAKNGVLFMDLQKAPFAFAAMDVTNGGCFFVNASKLENGRTWYQFGTNEITEKQLGIEALSYSEQHNAARDVIRQAGAPLYSRFYAPDVSPLDAARIANHIFPRPI